MSRKRANTILAALEAEDERSRSRSGSVIAPPANASHRSRSGSVTTNNNNNNPGALELLSNESFGGTGANGDLPPLPPASGRRSRGASVSSSHGILPSANNADEIPTNHGPIGDNDADGDAESASETIGNQTFVFNLLRSFPGANRKGPNEKPLWVDFNILKRSRTPTRRDGVIFAVNFLTFVLYLVSFTNIVISDRQVEKSNLLQKAVSQALPQIDLATTRDARHVRDFLTNDYIPMLSRFEQTSTFIGANIVVGAVQFLQTRAAIVECDNGLDLGSDVDLKLKCLRGTETEPFVGPRTGAKFEHVSMRRCKSNFPCPQTTGGLYYDQYPFNGFLVSYFNNSLYVGQVPYPISKSEDLLKDFITNQTTFLKVSLILFNPQYSMITEVRQVFEIPADGSVRRMSQYLFLPHSKKDVTDNTVLSFFVWIYCIVWLSVTTVRVIAGWRVRRQCLLCQMKGTMASNCWKCEKPVELTKKVAPCVWCSTPNPAMIHICWKQKLLDPWSIFTLANIIILAVARVMISTAKSMSEEFMAEVQTKIEEGLVPNVPFDRPMELFEIGIILNTVNIIMAYTTVYRFIGRAAWSATFLRVFSASGVLLAFFFIGFLTVYFGFVIAFHILLCDASSEFATIWLSFIGAFRAFMGFLEWDEVVLDDRRWVFSVLYVIFCWVLLLTMLNVLIALVSVEYYKSTQQIHFDLESQSFALLIEPVVNTVKQKARKYFSSKKDDGDDHESDDENEAGADGGDSGGTDGSDARPKRRAAPTTEGTGRTTGTAAPSGTKPTTSAEAMKNLVEQDDGLNEVMSNIHENVEKSGLLADNYFSTTMHSLMKANQELEIMEMFTREMTETLEIGETPYVPIPPPSQEQGGGSPPPLTSRGVGGGGGGIAQDTTL